MKAKHFRCDCGWPFHSLCINPLDDEWPGICITVVNSRHDFSFRERLKAAWRVLRGDEHAFSEVLIHRDDVAEFAEYVAELAKECRGMR